MKTNKSPSRPRVTTTHRRYEDVDIEFMGPEEDQDMPGTYKVTVIERGAELVLDLTEHDEPYLIVTKRGAERTGLRVEHRDPSSKRRLNGLGSSYAAI